MVLLFLSCQTGRLRAGRTQPERDPRRSLAVRLLTVNDISLFDSIDHDHPPVKLRVANGKILVAHAVGTVKLKLQQPDGSITEVLLHNVPSIDTG